jgi:hypothetical protein
MLTPFRPCPRCLAKVDAAVRAGMSAPAPAVADLYDHLQYGHAFQFDVALKWALDEITRRSAERERKMLN